MSYNNKLAGLAGSAALCALLAATPAWATNGYFAHGYSASQRAMGGAGTALTEDALIAAINPAGAVWVGDRLDFNLSLFAPTRNYSAGPVGENATHGIVRIGEDSVVSDNPRYFIPGFGFQRRIDERSSWGIVMYGNGGMNTEYHGNTAFFGENFAAGVQTLIDLGVPVPPPLNQLNVIDLATQCGGSLGGGAPVDGAGDTAGFCGNDDATAGVDLIQLFIVPHYARKLGERSSVGIAPIIAGQRFRADGLRAFAQFSNAPDRVSDNGYELSYGFGARVGFLTSVVPGFGLGASYQTRVYMTPFDKYAGLFAGEGDFDIPSNWNVGLSAHPTSRLRFALDWQRINYSEIDPVGRPMGPDDFINNCARPRLLAALGFGGSTAPNPSCLGSASGPGFGWQDMDVYKLGVQYGVGAIKLRAGYSRNDQPIPPSEVLFNILAPGVVEEHYTLGLNWQLPGRWALDLAAMYAPDRPVRGRNPLSNTNATALDLITGAPSNAQAFGTDPDDQEITLDMHQYEITVGLSYRFDGESP